jgi:hypothetical protein
LYGIDKGETDEGRPAMPTFADMVEQVSFKTLLDNKTSI